MNAPNSIVNDRARIDIQYEHMQKSQAILQIPILESMGYTVIPPTPKND